MLVTAMADGKMIDYGSVVSLQEAEMNRWRDLLSRHALVIFFALSYAISWSIALVLDGRLLPHGPMLAAMIVLGVTAGGAGVSGLWRQIVRRRAHWTWYKLAPGIILAIHLGAFAANLLLGATVLGGAHLQPAFILLLAPLLLFGGQWEEPGWSGFALPRLQERFARHPFGLLLTNLTLSVLRAGWHLPLVLYGHIPWYDAILFNFAFQFLITWLYNASGGSVQVVMLFHLASNLVFPVMLPIFGGADRVRYHLLFIALAWLVVFAVRPVLALKPGYASR